MIIGFSGKKQSGKSGCVKMLKEQGDFIEENFGDSLKQIVQICFNASPEQTYGSEAKKNERLECGATSREVMQKVGQGFRNIWPNCWVSAWKKRVETLVAMYGTDTILVGDVRYPNEVEEIHRQGGVVIRLLRAPYSDDHPSEVSLDTVGMDKRFGFVYFDAIIDNRTMTEEETHRAVLKLCEERGWL